MRTRDSLLIERAAERRSRLARAEVARLRANGYRIPRFWNGDVIESLDAVLDRIASALPKGPPLDPLSVGEGKA